ncbi:MAG: ABC transporter ATP-binding protein [Thermoleophilia bacterium]|nr:ABC transporter ATP-binding protein [Thermoleophilia bacterium]
MGSVIELEGVSKSFGSLQALDDLSLQLDEGEALGVVGPNGAGKTTMLSLIAGSLHPDRGRILFCGRDVTRVSPHGHCRLGIARTFQIPRPFGGMTVFENVLVGASFGPAGSDGEAEEIAVGVLADVGLLRKANTLAGSLPLLERKRLELARALAARPRVLLLDEIAGGLTEPEVLELVATIRKVRAASVSLVWIEHIVHALLAVVDRLVALDFGRKIVEGDPQAVMASPEVRSVYLGAGA